MSTFLMPIVFQKSYRVRGAITSIVVFFFLFGFREMLFKVDFGMGGNWILDVLSEIVSIPLDVLEFFSSMPEAIFGIPDAAGYGIMFILVISIGWLGGWVVEKMKRHDL